eukprot:4134332-Prymnesium_polylepis.2
MPNKPNTPDRSPAKIENATTMPTGRERSTTHDRRAGLPLCFRVLMTWYRRRTTRTWIAGRAQDAPRPFRGAHQSRSPRRGGRRPTPHPFCLPRAAWPQASTRRGRLRSWQALPCKTSRAAIGERQHPGPVAPKRDGTGSRW